MIKLDQKTQQSLNSKDFQKLTKIIILSDQLFHYLDPPPPPTYNLSKYLTDILKPLVSTSPHSANNVNAFLSKIKDSHVEPDEIMISFNVVSLFTSIPLDKLQKN
jgi:hypothetical protein